MKTIHFLKMNRKIAICLFIRWYHCVLHTHRQKKDWGKWGGKIWALYLWEIENVSNARVIRFMVWHWESEAMKGLFTLIINKRDQGSWQDFCTKQPLASVPHYRLLFWNNLVPIGKLMRPAHVKERYTYQYMNDPGREK